MLIDAETLQNVLHELKTNPALHFAKLTLHVQDGIVTISGRVDSQAERRAVVSTVKRVPGVTTLILEIRTATSPVIVKDTLLSRANPREVYAVFPQAAPA